MRLGEIRRMWMRMKMHADWLQFMGGKKRVFCVSVSLCRNKQTDKRKSRRLPPSSMCSLLVGVTETTTKGRGKNSHQDHSRTTAQTDPRAQKRRSGPATHEHVCTFCNMQQSSCNYIPPGVCEPQQSGVFFFCQFWQIFTKHAHLETKPII